MEYYRIVLSIILFLLNILREWVNFATQNVHIKGSVWIKE